MNRKKLIKFIDTVGEALDHYDREAVAIDPEAKEFSEFVCTEEEIRAMQTALSCIRNAVKFDDLDDPADFTSTLLAVHSTLKFALTLTCEDEEDAESEETDD